MEEKVKIEIKQGVYIDHVGDIFIVEMRVTKEVGLVIKCDGTNEEGELTEVYMRPDHTDANFIAFINLIQGTEYLGPL